jgi:ABC-type uncharacterized transport system permease subunit
MIRTRPLGMFLVALAAVLFGVCVVIAHGDLRWNLALVQNLGFVSLASGIFAIER